jgi:molecular chaperone GrpE
LKEKKQSHQDSRELGAEHREAPSDCGRTTAEAPQEPRGHKIPVSIVDKRRVGREGEAAESAVPDTKPLYVQQLEDRTRRTEAAYSLKVEELQQETQRSRERLLQDLEKRFKDKERALLLEVLSLLDDLSRACALTSSDPKVAEGLALIASKAGQFLKNHGCQTVEPLGEPFDPNFMEAVALQEGPANTVVGILQPGYSWEGSLLRAARVIVGRGDYSS